MTVFETQFETEFEWLDDLRRDLREDRVRLEPNGATDEALTRLRHASGFAWPDAHAAFLRRWNGATLWEARLFSCEELTDVVTRERSEGRAFRSVYAAKPAFLRPFAEANFSSVVACFDERGLSGPHEARGVYVFDHDADGSARLGAPSFEAFVLFHAFWHLGDDLDAFFDQEADDEDAESERAERVMNAWTERLRAELIARGAVFDDDPYRPRGWAAPT